MPNESLLLASTDGAEQTAHGGSRYLPITHVQQKLHVVPYYWDPIGLTYVVAQQASGGGGGGGAVTVADGADVTQGAKADAAWDGSAASVTAQSFRRYMSLKLEAIRALLAGTLSISAASLPLPTGASTAAKQPALGTAGTPSADVLTVQGAASMTALKVDGSAVTQPVSIAATVNTNTGLSQPLTGTQLRASAVPVSNTNLDVALSTRLKPADTLTGVTTVGSVTSITNALPTGANTIGAVNQGAANATPWNENLSQVGGTAITAKALPTGGTGLTAIPVYNNAIQALTYTFGARNIVTGVLVANTAKQVLSLEVAAAGTKTVKIRRILAAAIQTTALAGTLDFQINRGSAASSAGSAVTAGVRVTGDAAATTVCKTLPTITAATVLDVLPFAANGAAAVGGQPRTVIYDWQEAGETKPWTLKPGVIDSFVLSAISTAAQNWTISLHITLTEE